MLQVSKQTDKSKFSTDGGDNDNGDDHDHGDVVIPSLHAK